MIHEQECLLNLWIGFATGFALCNSLYQIILALSEKLNDAPKSDR